MYVAEMALLGVAIGIALGWTAIAVTSGPPRQRFPLVGRKIDESRDDNGEAPCNLLR